MADIVEPRVLGVFHVVALEMLNVNPVVFVPCEATVHLLVAAARYSPPEGMHDDCVHALVLEVNWCRAC